MHTCTHQNGEVTAYLVRYGEEGGGNRTVQTVSGLSNGGYTTITGLTKKTVYTSVYTVQVVAFTSAGTPESK